MELQVSRGRNLARDYGGTEGLLGHTATAAHPTVSQGGLRKLRSSSV